MKNIWIIGASSGIGEALADKLESEGNLVIRSARSSKKYNFDATIFDDAKKVFEEILEKFSKIDMVIFSCGTYSEMTCENFNLEEAKKILQTNFESLLNILAIINPYFIKQKQGHIAVISSIAGYFGMPNSLTYSASKAAVSNLCESLYIELSKHNIKVQLISPGFVKTPLTDKNKFKMPFIISASKAAQIITKDLNGNKFEIHFPKIFTYFFKFLHLLPTKWRMKLLQNLRV